MSRYYNNHQSDKNATFLILLFLFGFILWVVFNILREKIRLSKQERLEAEYRNKIHQEKINQRVYERIENENQLNEKRKLEIQNEIKLSCENEIDKLIHKEFGTFISIHKKFFRTDTKTSLRESFRSNFGSFIFFNQYNLLPVEYEDEIISIYYKFLKTSSKNDSERFHPYASLDSVVKETSSFFRLKKEKLKENWIVCNSDDSFEISLHPIITQVPLNNKLEFRQRIKEKNYIVDEKNKRFLFEFIDVTKNKSFFIREGKIKNVVVIKSDIHKSDFINKTKDILLLDELVKNELVYSLNNYVYYCLERNIDLIAGGFALEACGSYYLTDFANSKFPRMTDDCYKDYENFRNKFSTIRSDKTLNEIDKEKLNRKERQTLHESGIQDIYRNYTIESHPSLFLKATVFMVHPNFDSFQRFISIDDLS